MATVMNAKGEQPVTDGAVRADEVRYTRGEKLRIWRRRANLTQTQAAKRFGVTFQVYREWEHDLDVSKAQPSVQVRGVKSHELATIMRERAGLCQKQLADRIGMSRIWVCKMERGATNDRALRQYWNIELDAREAWRRGDAECRNAE